MTSELLFIASTTGLLIGVVGLVTVRIMARNRARYLASRRTHPAE